MLYYALVFFVVAVIAAFFGFSGIAGSAVGIAKLLFIGFMIAAVVGAAFHFFSERGKRSR
jgi:uncharacterized membrane protein YtjA (UPF0391 family)